MVWSRLLAAQRGGIGLPDGRPRVSGRDGDIQQHMGVGQRYRLFAGVGGRRIDGDAPQRPLTRDHDDVGRGRHRLTIGRKNFRNTVRGDTGTADDGSIVVGVGVGGRTAGRPPRRLQNVCLYAIQGFRDSVFRWQGVGSYLSCHMHDNRELRCPHAADGLRFHTDGVDSRQPEQRILVCLLRRDSSIKGFLNFGGISRHHRYACSRRACSTEHQRLFRSTPPSQHSRNSMNSSRRSPFGAELASAIAVTGFLATTKIMMQASSVLSPATIFCPTPTACTAEIASRPP